MSHTVKIKTEVRNVEAIKTACKRVGAEFLGQKSHKLYGSNYADGVGVKLVGWYLPVVFNVETGAASLDNYGGSWGAQSVLDKFLQAYAVEVVKLQARKSGQTVTESVQADGSVKLSVSVGS
jgi:hypothetical protein